MADATTVNRYLKTAYTKAQVKEIRDARLQHGDAKSCTLSEDETHWILTTVWPGG